MKKGNIVGEPFASYVNKQIEQRQKFHGSGFTAKRDPKHIQYLNSKLSWVKMASSVSVKTTEEGFITTTGGEKRLTNLGLSPVNDFLGQGLARKAVLFNGLSEFNSNTSTEIIDKNDSSTNPYGKDTKITKEKFKQFTQRSGISKSTEAWNSSNAYGLGGNDFGLQPMPGIIDIQVSHLNRGSIRKATVSLKAYNATQFSILETLYLRLGYTMILEWGNSHYIENDITRDNNQNIVANPGDILQMGNTLIEDYWFTDDYNKSAPYVGVLNKIEQYRKRYDGNYDGFFGRVSNFNWNYNNDGSYDITIDLMSLGDVIESLKINTLTNPAPSSDDSSINKNTISNILYYLKKGIETGGNNYFTSPKEEEKTKPFIGAGIAAAGIFFATGNLSTALESFSIDEVPEEYKNYIRFGEFLKLLEKKVIIKLKNESKNFPIISIETDQDSNIMSLHPNQFSIDPRVCIINSNYFSPPLKEYPSFFNNLEKFYDPEVGVCGKIMNIYLNFALIEQKLKSNLDKKGNLSLFTFLESICDEINKSLGGVNNLEPIIDEDRNSIVIVDQNTTSQKERNEIRKKLIGEEETESTPFEIYGYNKENSTSNFVKNFSFKTEIGPDLSTIISIGATAQGSVVGEDATAFSKWNSGLTDRFQQNISNGEEEGFDEISLEEEYDFSGSTEIIDPLEVKGYPFYIKNRKFNNAEQKKFNSIDSDISSRRLKGDLNILNNKLRKENKTKKENERLKKERLEKEEQKSKNIKKSEDRRFGEDADDITKYLIRAWGGEVFEGTNYNAPPKYLIANEEFINTGFKLFTKDFFERIKKNQNVTSSLGFIPVKLSLDIEGLSGIKIYQSLKINTKFLPYNYPEVLEFLVTKVNHTIKDNQWVTQIETISQPVIVESPIETSTFTESIGNQQLPLQLPVNVGLTTTPQINIRNDDGGKGKFGASREKGTHKGLDISTSIGQPIYAPISGNIKSSRAKESSKLNGISIEGTGEYKGIQIWIFYIRPLLPLPRTIIAGEQVGTAVDLSKNQGGDYSEAVTDHIHFSVAIDGIKVNPINLFYYTNSSGIMAPSLQGNSIFVDS